MRHRKAGVKLNRTTSHRQAMFRNMVTSLFKHDRISTTDVKARELRRWADQMITLAKRGDLHARRQVLAIIQEKAVVHKLFQEAEKRFGEISGGYTRIVKIGHRAGDAAPISLIELVNAEQGDKKSKKKPAPAGKKKAPAAIDTKPESSTGAKDKAAADAKTAPAVSEPENQKQTAGLEDSVQATSSAQDALEAQLESDTPAKSATDDGGLEEPGKKD